MTRAERELKGVERSMEEHGRKADELLTKADAEDRDTTPKEKEEVEEHLKAIKALKERKSDLEDAISVEKEAREVGRKLGIEDESQKKTPAVPKRVKTLGDQFVESEQYKSLLGGGFRGDFKTGQIELDTKATLVEGDQVYVPDSTPDGAGGALVAPDQRAGIQQILFERLTVANLLASGTTDSNAVNYIRETTADPGSIGVVDEGADKPEAELEFDAVQTGVKKIASFLPVSDEMLEDAAQIRSYINARLSLFVQQEEENQLLNGSGGSEIDGLLNQVPVGNQDLTSTAEAANGADHIYAGFTKVRAAFLEPDGAIVHPDDWATLRLLKDGVENYIGGSPFSNGIGEPSESLWNKRVVVTSAITQGTALVGAFGTAAQVYRRGGLTVEASNSHADFFKKNLTAIRAEERIALAVYRPEAFATVAVDGS